MVQVIWQPEALSALDLIRAYIRQFDHIAAARLADRLVAADNSLSDFPERGRRAGRYRELVTVPPYVIRYRLVDGTVHIIAIKHSAQRR
jgi:plasmid stabilization system protein ParE